MTESIVSFRRPPAGCDLCRQPFVPTRHYFLWTLSHNSMPVFYLCWDCAPSSMRLLANEWT